MSNDIWYLWDEAETRYIIGDYQIVVRYFVDEIGDGLYIVQVVTWDYGDSFLIDEKYYEEVK